MTQKTTAADVYVQAEEPLSDALLQQSEDLAADIVARLRTRDKPDSPVPPSDAKDDNDAAGE